MTSSIRTRHALGFVILTLALLLALAHFAAAPAQSSSGCATSDYGICVPALGVSDPNDPYDGGGGHGPPPPPQPTADPH